MRWKLPPLDPDEMKLSGATRGSGKALVDRLLKVRETGNEYEEIVHNWIDGLRTRIVTSNSWIQANRNDDLEISLYADDRIRKGLVCVAKSPGPGVFSQPWTEVIKPGDTFIGAAYRRRQPLAYNPLSGSLVDLDEYKVRIPDDWRSAPDGEIEYIANCAIPLTYPRPRGRRVAVISFSTKNQLSRLLALLTDKKDSEDVNELKLERQKGLIQEVMERQSDALVAALRIPPE